MLPGLFVPFPWTLPFTLLRHTHVYQNSDAHRVLGFGPCPVVRVPDTVFMLSNLSHPAAGHCLPIWHALALTRQDPWAFVFNFFTQEPFRTLAQQLHSVAAAIVSHSTRRRLFSSLRPGLHLQPVRRVLSMPVLELQCFFYDVPIDSLVSHPVASRKLLACMTFADYSRPPSCMQTWGRKH